MKLLQINVWMGRLTKQVVQLIEKEQPDIITTQEMFSSDKPVPFPDRMFDIFEQMQEAGGYEHSFFSPVCEFDYSGVKVGMGNGIHSKFPLSETKTVFTNGSFQTNGDASIFEANFRNMQLATVTTPDGAAFSLVNHHGYWEPNPVGSEKTVANMQKVLDEIRTLQDPIIFAGDLNVDPGTPAMQLFDGYLEDLTATYGIQSTLGVLGKVQGVAPDHILVSSDINVLRYEVLPDLVSDHQAVMLEFELR